MPRPPLIPTLLGLALTAAFAASGCASQPPSPAGSSPAGDAARPDAMTKEEARRIAEKVAREAGYSPDEYEVESVERVKEAGSFEGMWRVSFEHLPPAPPGGHATVYVNPVDGTTQLFHGK